MSDPFAPIGGSISGDSKKPTSGWVNVRPVPDDAALPPPEHPALGKPTSRWAYADASCSLLGFACRFDGPDGKQFRPLTYWRREKGKRFEWRWEAWPTPRPLYNLDRLAENPKAVVVVTEGEKAADAAGRLLPEHVAITSPNRSKSAAKADWSALSGRRVVIWPDADAPGAHYADEISRLAREAGAASVAVLTPPDGAAQGWDAADAEAEGWTTARTEAFVSSARSAAVVDLEQARRDKRASASGAKKASSAGGTDPEGRGRQRRPAQRDQLAALCGDVDLWHDEAGDCFATYPVNGHRESWSLASKSFRRWLSARNYEQTGLAPGGQALEDTIRVLEARAYSEGPERTPRLRVGEAGDKAFLDLVDAAWRSVEIDGDGWRIVDRAPVAFTRSGQMRPLPEPEAGYGVEELRRFVNVERDEDFVLLVAWILAAMRADGPYPVLTFAGEQGTGKSMLSRLVRSLIDPNAAPIRAVPKDDRDLVIGAVNSHVIALDNLSSVPAWLSDALCRLATGGGFASRMLHTDREESVMQAVRPIILNGIPSLTERPDLASRAVTVRLRPIAETERRTETEFWADWSTTAPRVLGALLDGFATGLRRVASVRLDRLPRMADFALWATACEPGLGFEPGTFMAAYTANQADTTETTFEADPVAVAVRDFVRSDYPMGWNGSATELLAALNTRTPESIRRLKLWPPTSSSLGNRIDRIAPVLRAQGFVVERRHSGTRTITIAPVASARS